MMDLRAFGILLAIALFFSSCVTKKVFNEQLTMAEKYKAESEICAENLAETKAELDKCNEKVNRLEALAEALISDSSDLSQRLQNLKLQCGDLNALYDSLNAQNQAILKMSAREKEELKNELLKKEQELLRREQRVAELEGALAAKDSALIRLKDNITEALIGFSDDQLTVEVKDGKIYVSLSEKLLFNTGSSTVDPKGVEALNSVAQVLASQTDIDIVVEGHTDNVPYLSSSGPIKDNWDLSVLRATSVVRILTAEGNLDKDQVVAAGRGEYHPVADNESEEGKASNRRTEIIISPNLEQIFDILDK